MKGNAWLQGKFHPIGCMISRTSSMESGHGTELVQGAVYEFHKPEPDQRIQVEIVFMHGLQVNAADLKDAYYKTWRTAAGNEVWPETWLKEKYPNARILSLAYDSSARQTRTAGNMGPYLLGESLLAQMVSPAGNIGQNDCPVVFVGHSLGGLIAKEIVVRCASDRANAKYQNLLRNLKAVFFYATPHGGSYLADSWITNMADWLRIKKSSLVEYLKPEGTDRTRMHHDFHLAVNKDCKFYVVAEGRETPLLKGCRRSSAWIVRENSARLPGHDFELLPYADHKTVCKPQGQNDIGYLKLINCIDAVIQDYTRRIAVDLSVGPIGIEDKIVDISELLERPEVSIVGLFGMGGAGKTTLSKEFYNRNANKYVKSCYLENVKSKGPQDIQKELLEGLCGEKLDQNEPVNKQHLDKIKDCFLNQKVLAVIDDVISEDCLRDLQVFHALENGSQSNKSKVVVTGRDSAILPRKYLNSGMAVIVPVHGITKGSDLELFRRYAFDAVDADKKEMVETEFRVEAEKIVRLCNGLPLSLEVLGKYLGNSLDKDLRQWKEIWVEAYERLQKAESINGNNQEKLWSSLRISYDHLGDREQKMFLDFACIFSEMGGKKELVERVWGSPMGVQNLVNKSLLKDEGGRFVMHDQLRDMGRYVLLEEALKDHPIYLWEGHEFSETYMKFKKHTTNLGVPYIARVEQEVGTSLRHCNFYSKLRLLSVTGPDVAPSWMDDCLSQCPGDLRWFHLKDLGVPKIGISNLGSFEGLRVLQIFYCDNIVELSEDIDKLIHLVVMEVRSCHELQNLPDSIGKLRNLKRLVIASCSALRVVPESVGELPEVEHLSFQCCWGLTAIEGKQICTQNLMHLKLPIVPTTCLRPSPQLRSLVIDARGLRGVQEFPQDFFKVDMPKLEGIKLWIFSFAEVVLKNPDDSQLVLKTERDWAFIELEVHRQYNGSISQLSEKERFNSRSIRRRIIRKEV